MSALGAWSLYGHQELAEAQSAPRLGLSYLLQPPCNVTA